MNTTTYTQQQSPSSLVQAQGKREVPTWAWTLGGLAALAAAVAAVIYFWRRNATPAVVPATEPATTTTTPSRTSTPSGPPPNLSGNANGYNTAMFPDPKAVRAAMIVIGYPVEPNSAPLEPKDPRVEQFQRDWNKAVAAYKASDPAYWDWVSDKPLLTQLTGTLTADGVAGAATLRALEIAMMNQTMNKVGWQSLVSG
jgi:hypothetical protein